MRQSVNRILTTHTGSLPRSPDLVELMFTREEGTPVDLDHLNKRVREAVAGVVRQQVDVGLDIINDGEMSKPSYATYVKDRLDGFGGEGTLPMAGDLADFPEFAARTRPERSSGRVRVPCCIGPVRVRDREAVQRDLASLKAALQGIDEKEAFVTSVSPGQISRFLRNQYYPTHEAYLYALADAMKEEYRAIVEAGFLLQVDCPDLAAGRHTQFAAESLDAFRRNAALHVEALDYALDGLPPDRLRMHICWGNYPGPHHRDVPLRDIVDIVLCAHPSGVSFEAANPRHEHEWRIFEAVKLPEDKILIPGVIDSCTNYIEHPELVAQRIARFAQQVGRERVIAGVDCGFGTWVGSTIVDPMIAWAKLRALVEGAALASAELW